ncbi:MAG TPA: D-2-hydroxyacid dehydrogenase [Candidatus Ligilactobacillus excrementipullorum]|nr:D-2-hydroxyacid dehydrogenase [Candidatus Ligilactobacillus excrementipullorum]
MTKLLLFNVLDDEIGVIDQWLAKNPTVQIDTNRVTLTAETVDLAQGYDGIVLQQDNLIEDPVIYQKLHEFGIKQISLRTTGYETVDLKAAAANDLVVTNVPAYSPRSVSELVLAHTMWLLRHLNVAAKRESHNDFTWENLQAREIHELTVGIIGAGKIGSEVARIFKALGSHVIVSDPVHRPELNSVVTYVDQETVFKEADIITMHTPLLDSTYHVVNKAAFQMMKPTAIFINASRGAVVDTPALLSALKTGEIAAAGIDTIENEADIFSKDFSQSKQPNEWLQELLSLDNATVSPHIGFYTDIAVKNMVEISLADALTVIAGKHSAHEISTEE